MANKGPCFGLSRQCQLKNLSNDIKQSFSGIGADMVLGGSFTTEYKTLAKFDVARARQALSWMEEVLGEDLKPSSHDIQDQFDVKKALKDGQALCRLVNVIRPGAILKTNWSKLAFKEMENIEFFLRACRDMGMKEVDLFQTQDLYEAKSMYSVINCLFILGSLARKHGFEGPTIGVKMADKNERNFSEEQIAKGKMVINLQYGSNQGASQQGMRAYGATRKM